MSFHASFLHYSVCPNILELGTRYFLYFNASLNLNQLCISSRKTSRQYSIWGKTKGRGVNNVFVTICDYF